MRETATAIRRGLGPNDPVGPHRMLLVLKAAYCDLVYELSRLMDMQSIAPSQQAADFYIRAVVARMTSSSIIDTFSPVADF